MYNPRLEVSSTIDYRFVLIALDYLSCGHGRHTQLLMSKTLPSIRNSLLDLSKSFAPGSVLLWTEGHSNVSLKGESIYINRQHSNFVSSHISCLCKGLKRFPYLQQFTCSRKKNKISKVNFFPLLPSEEHISLKHYHWVWRFCTSFR